MDIEETWSSDMEFILDNIRKNSLLLSDHHKEAYLYYRSYLKYFRIPTIILSALNSVISIGLSAYVPQKFVSEITCVVSLVCGIITSIELYLNIQKYMECELMMSKDFYILSTDIFKTLALDRANRGINGKTFLDNNYSIYCKLIENSNISTSEMADNLTPIKLKLENSEIKSDIENQNQLPNLLNISATSFNIESPKPFSLSNTLKGVTKKVEKTVEQVKEQIKEEVKESVKDQVKEVKESVKDQVKDQVKEVKELVKDQVNDVKDSVKDQVKKQVKENVIIKPTLTISIPPFSPPLSIDTTSETSSITSDALLPLVKDVKNKKK